MSRRRKNTFAKAISHIKSTKFDMVEDAPTNRTSGFMTITPNSPNPDYVPPHYPAPEDLPDFSIDGEDGKDTTGLFKSDGITPRTVLPPITETSPDISYILGPMCAMYYGWWGADGKTTIGYIKQEDRRMQNLGTIDGKLSDWDGVSGFSSYGDQLTLEQAVWFKNVQKAPGQTNDPDTANYRAFYPGPPSNTPDAFGRYYCTITGEGLDSPRTAEGEPMIPPGQGEMSPEDIFAAIMDRINKGKKLSKAEEEWLEQQGLDDFYKGGNTESPLGNLGLLGATTALVKGALAIGIGMLVKGAGAAGLVSQATPFFGDANNSGDYNKQLASKLGISVFTGQPQEIKLSDTAKADQANNINVDNLAKNLNIGPLSDPSAESTINPKNKSKILEGGWGVQGGSEVNYDPSTGLFTITSEKTLRTDQEGDQFNDSGKQTHFADIPSPSNEKVSEIAGDLLGNDFVNNFLGGVSNLAGGQITDYETGTTYNNAWDYMKANPDELQKFKDNLGQKANEIATGSIQGSASNIVHIRNALTSIGVPQSEVEKIGGGYGQVYSQTSYTLDELPQEVQNVIKSKMNQTNSYRPRGRVISESKRSIIKNLKKPVVIPETKQKKYKVKPKIRGIENSAIISKPVETPKEYQPKGGRNLWGQYEYQRNVIQSQERKNEVLNLIGEGEGAFRYMLTTSKKLNAQEMEKFWGLNPDMHSHFYGGKKYKVTRKEQIHGDYLVFLVDEDGVKSNILQSKLNEKLAEEDDKRILDEYNKINPKPKRNDRISYEKDPLFKKVAKRLKKEIDYPDKPAKMGYPNDPPPKMVDGWHPEYGKRYKYDKLDPVSAVMMKKAPTGDPEIDANVTKAAKKPK